MAPRVVSYGVDPLEGETRSPRRASPHVEGVGHEVLVEHDIEVARELTPTEKLHQALELMDAGLRLKRDLLRNARPFASEIEQQVAFEQWLLSGD